MDLQVIYEKYKHTTDKGTLHSYLQVYEERCPPRRGASGARGGGSEWWEPIDVA